MLQKSATGVAFSSPIVALFLITAIWKILNPKNNFTHCNENPNVDGIFLKIG